MKLLTVNQAAKVKGVSRQAVHAAIKAGKIDTLTVDTPSVRIRPQSLALWQPNPNMKRAGRPKQ